MRMEIKTDSGILVVETRQTGSGAILPVLTISDIDTPGHGTGVDLSKRTALHLIEALAVAVLESI